MAAKLHVDSLSTKTSIKKLKSALDNLSTNLNVLYDEAILRIEKQPLDYHILAEKALRWVAYTYRPLNVKALQEALAIELEDLEFDCEAIQPIGLILDVCAGLLVYDEENKTVRLVHHTAQDYFDKLASSKFDDAHVLIAKECLVYLNYGVFQNSQTSTDDEVSGTSDAASFGGTSDAASDSQDEQYMFYLFGYASTFWAQHAMTKRDSTLGLPEVHQFLARHPRVHLQETSDYDFEPDASCPSFLEYNQKRLYNRRGCEIAAFYGLNDELEMFCEELEGAQTPTHYLDSCLHLAVRTGQYRATEIVLDHGAVIDNTNGWSTALHQAVKLGHLDLMKLLLARGADVDARDNYGATPLLFAGEYSQEHCIIALLNHGADIHIKDWFGGTILHWASANGLLDIVNTLLALNMKADERDQLIGTPLMYAVRNFHTDCMLALLEHGADINSKSVSGSTALHKAAIINNLNDMNILLARGAETEVRDKSGQTPLWDAYRHTGCILALIDYRANVNSKDNSGSTILHQAASFGNLDVVSILLAPGAETEIRDNRGRTPLWVAAKRCHNECMLALIGYGADVNVQDDDGITPLHLASAANSIKSLVELLKHDAAVDTRSQSMYSVKFKSNMATLRGEFDFDLNEGCRMNVASAFQFNNNLNLREILRCREEVLELLVWKDGLTALDIAMLREHEEMIRMLKPLTPPTGQPLTLSVEAFLLEKLGVVSIQEAEEEVDRRSEAERKEEANGAREATRAMSRAISRAASIIASGIASGAASGAASEVVGEADKAEGEAEGEETERKQNESQVE